MKRVAVSMLILLAGCDLYWSHDGDDVVCNGGGYAGGAEPAYEYRDPSTGVCTYYEGGGGCYEDSGGCCAYPSNGDDAAGAAVPAAPYGSTCEGSCEGLDENSCATTYGCHAEYGTGAVAYPGGVVPDVVDQSGVTAYYLQCWDIQPLQPIEGGQCVGLDAYTCAQHDDCASIMAYGADGNTYFQECAAETKTGPSCDGVDCGPGSHCEQECYPCDEPNADGSTCMSSCSTVCVADQSCNGIDCGPGYSCEVSCDANGSCYPGCYMSGPSDPGDCTGAVDCDEAAPACPSGTTAGIANGCYTGFCIPKTDCGPKDPGSCDSTGVHCNIAPPSCPANTVPGSENGCWTGYCIPKSSCPVPACETLTDEASCTSRFDCQAVYDGSGCTCFPDGECTCTSEKFSRCQSGAVIDPPPPQPSPPTMPSPPKSN